MVAVWSMGALLVAAAAIATNAVRLTRGVRARARLPLLAAPPRRRRIGAASRARRRLAAELPDVLDSIGRAAASGLSLVESLRRGRDDATGVLAEDLDDVLSAVDAGAPVVATLERWADRRPDPEVRLAVCAIGQAASSGGALGRAAHSVADTLRANLDARRVVISQAAQGRASATVVALAPVVVLLLAALVDTSAIEILFTTPSGLLSLASGLALDGLAAWWMAALITSAERVGR